MKGLLKFLLAVVIALAILVGVAFMFSGLIIKSTVQGAGSKLLGVPVKLAGAGLSPAHGRIEIRGLVIGSPEGFEAGHIFKVQRMLVEADLRSLFSGCMVVRRIRIEAPDIVLEQSAEGSNLGKLLEKLKGQPSGPPAPGAGAPPGKAAAEPKIIIDDFLITGGQVTMIVPGIPAQTAALPDVHLQDIGRKANGVTPSAALGEVLNALLRSATRAAASSPELINQGLKALGIGK